MVRSLSVPALALLAWLSLFSLEPLQGGKVLVMPVDGSHWLSMKILVEELSRMGHEMVVLVPETSFLIRASANYTTKSFRVPYTMAELNANLDHIRKNAFERPPQFTDIFLNLGNLIEFTNMQVKGCEGLLYDKPLMKSLRETGFDVLLTDPFLPCGTILADSFSLPAIYFLRGIPCRLDESAAQCPSPPSFVPRFFTGYSDKMTFPQRARNMIMTVFEMFLCHKLFASADELASRYLQKDTTYKELLGHAAVWLLRYDFTFEFPKPQMPNMVHIGGINCAKRGPLTKVKYIILRYFKLCTNYRALIAFFYNSERHLLVRLYSFFVFFVFLTAKKKKKCQSRLMSMAKRGI
ncbi:UDP-glucuronosyltransferase 1A1-like [Pimephales promelas]|uniref:UDP-glucuronosyltransferase 1A1-like n=1 Tax=Pimephales promelas TaxID=90988 RepID=UPI0019554ED9|nr:UDP-glucuronosyltransferase 1A1-like [Pimephales promelas]